MQVYGRSKGVFVGAGGDRGIGANHPDVTVFGGGYRAAHSGLDYLHHRYSSPHGIALACVAEHCCTGRVAGDHERYSHYVRKEKIVESAVLGVPVTALCGKIWVPGRDPQKFPVCPTCKEIYQGLRPEPPADNGGKVGGGE